MPVHWRSFPGSLVSQDECIRRIVDDQQVVRQVRQKLPRLFLLAELESQRNGKVGMEVGSAREKILIALLMYKFGLDRVDTGIAITDVSLS